jgi:hypothetical protein
MAGVCLSQAWLPLFYKGFTHRLQTGISCVTIGELPGVSSQQLCHSLLEGKALEAAGRPKCLHLEFNRAQSSAFFTVQVSEAVAVAAARPVLQVHCAEYVRR